jgi:hypothetical protein
MSHRRLRIILALYPPRWRRRYGDELRQLVTELQAEKGASRVRIFGDLLFGAARQRFAVPSAFGTGAVMLATVLAVGLAGFAIIQPHQHSGQQAPPARVVVERNHAGRITAVRGAPVTVVINPKTNHVVSIHRRRGG